MHVRQKQRLILLTLKYFDDVKIDILRYELNDTN